MATKLMKRKTFLVVKSNEILIQDVELQVVPTRKYPIRDRTAPAGPKGDCNNNPIIGTNSRVNITSTKLSTIVDKLESYEFGEDNSLREDRSESPVRLIPPWAEDSPLLRTLRWTQRISPEVIFAQPDPPDLDAMFPGTSSSRNIWHSPSK